MSLFSLLKTKSKRIVRLADESNDPLLTRTLIELASEYRNQADALDDKVGTDWEAH